MLVQAVRYAARHAGIPQTPAYPPAGMEDREAEIVHNAVAVAVAVAIDLHTNREALHTQVKIWAVGTLDANIVRDVLVTIVAVVQGPARDSGQRQLLIIPY